MYIDYSIFEERSLFYMKNKRKIRYGGNPNLFALSFNEVDIIKKEVTKFLKTSSQEDKFTLLRYSMELRPNLCIELGIAQRGDTSWDIRTLEFQYSITDDIYYSEYFGGVTSVCLSLKKK